MVVVGFSGASDSVPPLLWAAQEAARRGSTLTVLSAVSVQGVLTGPGGDQGMVAPEAAAAAEQALAEARATVADVEGLTMEGKVVFGSPAATLVDASADADLVVVGNRGRSELAAAVLGSVAYSVISHAQCPVVVVRGDGTRTLTSGSPVVVGVDGSHAGRRALEFAASTAARAKAPLVLLHAWEPDAGALAAGVDAWSTVVTEEGEDARRSFAEQELSAVTADLTARYPGLTVTTQAISQKPSKALAAASEDAALVVVGTRGRGGFAGLLLGSVSHGVIHEASCPVAVVR